jgi:hypothetical protein
MLIPLLVNVVSLVQLSWYSLWNPCIQRVCQTCIKRFGGFLRGDLVKALLAATIGVSRRNRTLDFCVSWFRVLSYFSWFPCVEVEVLVHMLHNNCLYPFNGRISKQGSFHCWELMKSVTEDVLEGFFLHASCCGCTPEIDWIATFGYFCMVICCVFESSF